MKLVLEIHHEQDLKILLPLLERLKIQVLGMPAPLAAKKNNGRTSGSKKQQLGKKNYDPEKLEGLFAQLKEMKAFSEIADPIAWQKHLRDEWN
ncbi:MAG: hypothetical protein HY842_07355 [Bacteroidetes bacterium]|nr:hypothetical protein [Bacteroidota bacterium]